MRKYLLNLIFIVTSIAVFSIQANGQTISTSPSDVTALTENVKITFSVAGTDLAGEDNLYIWGWSNVGDFLTNGTEWSASQDVAKLTKVTDETYTYEFPITHNTATYKTFADIVDSSNDPTALKTIGCLVKTKDGSKKSGDLDITLKDLSVAINVTSPLKNQIFKQGDNVAITATSPSSSKLIIKVNGSVVKELTGTSISYTIQSVSSGELNIEVSASADGLTATENLNYFVGSTVVKADRPSYASLLGPNYNGTEVTVVLQDPAKLKQFINVVGSFNNWGDRGAYAMKLDVEADANYWWYTFSSLDVNKEYIYQYLIDGSLIIADPYTEKVSDEQDKYINVGYERYPNLITYPSQANGLKASILQINQTEYVWKNTSFQPVSMGEALVYEMLIRDFSKSSTYEEAIAELDKIKALGANTIHLMPVNEFDGNSSWGYNPSFYFAPDKYYGSKNKLKEFIDEAHGKGMAVVLDLVLNHSTQSSPFCQMYNNGEIYDAPNANNPWYNEESNFDNDAVKGWGPDFNHESVYTQALVDSINAHWMKYYNVDGYRFDFTKGFGNNPKTGSDDWGSKYDQDRIDLLVRMTNEIKKRNPDAYVIFEHLSDLDEEQALAKEGITLWGNANHDFREVVKGGNANLDWQSPKTRDMPITGVMSYMESHDEERLIYDSEANGQVSQLYDLTDLQNGIDREKLAAAFFFMVPGPKMIWQFGESGYNVSINQSEYQGEVNEGNRTSEKPLISEFDTQNDAIRKQLSDVYTALIKLRNDYDLGELSDDQYSFDLKSEMKTISLDKGAIHIRIVGNFSLNEESYTYDYSSASSTWYSYFNNGDEVNASGTFDLKASEFKILTNIRVTTPVDGLVTGFDRIFEVNPYGFKQEEEIKIYFNPGASDKTFGTSLTLEAGVVLDSHGSGNISNKNTISMTKEGNKYVASYVPNDFFSLSTTDKPFQMSLKVSDAQGVTEGEYFVDFEENNKKLFLVGDILGNGWDPSSAIEMKSDGEGGFILESVQLTKGEFFKIIDEKSWNGGQWGHAGPNKLKASTYGDDIEVTSTGVQTIRANINDLTYSIENPNAIEDNQTSQSIKAYPNPTSSLVQFTGTVLAGQVEVLVRDNMGRVVTTFEQVATNNTINIDLTSFPVGMYYVELLTVNDKAIKKVIRQ
ncbi:alpha-amylase family glycosyl hydrolase [Flammeovirga kamogawensis]|uniref:T9SS type A sorting domain-containing protein n=1 Tax=Flammeovirga kamogawensis TaxID=373891 RepID=A0ABX8GYB5_9BACT|nr:alpha-amylase family glycosyl hydrolase [Flammeovirga kamogawensis]MBB6462893.1 1,4-alpha-glucan branching enzyme [Flammeovirga kamogawensis]QWG08327.1 T9SS type A sorting domain-containing protein [Flammeovirga kamogawensis]TRX66622.1 T9SS type A sorting domain-containing protein [Flammeovirga kamogawensis]